MKAIKKISLEVSTDLKALDDVLSCFDQLNQSFIPRRVWLQCQLALAEGFTNAVRHAHKNLQPDAPIYIEATLFSECLEMLIWDRGPVFDLEAMTKKMLKKVNNHAGGGRGLLLLQKMADTLSYTRTEDNRNCLLFVKYYQPNYKQD